MICPKDGKDCACNVIIGRTICDPPERSGDEFAAMARDAERYRWLRDGTQRLAGVGSWYRQVWTSWGDEDSLDKAIDAAMAERNKETA